MKLLNRLLNGFDGKLTSSKWAAIAKCSPNTALRDKNESDGLCVSFAALVGVENGAAIGAFFQESFVRCNGFTTINAMNTIYRDGKLKISVYADHAPPHFHVRTPQGDSSVDLATMVEVAGSADRKLLAKAISWAFANKALIEAEWKKLNGE